MTSDKEFEQFVVDQVEPDCELSFRMMFGEYVVYSKGKVVALICDNKLFVKPTDGGRKFIGECVEAPPYTGAKPCLLIQDQLENRGWLSQLVRVTEAGLPAPKPKKKK